MQELVSAISLGSIYLLFALGMSLTWGTIDVLNFAHGAIFMFSTFTAYLVLQQAALPVSSRCSDRRRRRRRSRDLIQVLAFEPILKRARNQAVGGDADPHRRHRHRHHPAGDRPAAHQEQPVRPRQLPFHVTVYDLVSSGSPTSRSSRSWPGSCSGA